MAQPNSIAEMSAIAEKEMLVDIRRQLQDAEAFRRVLGVDDEGATIYNFDWAKPKTAAGLSPVELCPACGSSDLAKIKGCIVCLTCRRKQDCNGW